MSARARRDGSGMSCSSGCAGAGWGAEPRSGGAERFSLNQKLLLVFAICLFDTVSSAVLFHHNLAVEANPLLRPFAEAGVASFVSAKILTFVPALLAAEWYGRRRPRFVEPLLRFTAIAYTGIYLLFTGAQFLG